MNKLNRILVFSAIALCAVACGNDKPSASPSRTPTVASQGAPPSTSARLACDIYDLANLSSFFSQYIVPGTLTVRRPKPGSEVGSDGESVCDSDWTVKPHFDRQGDAPTGIKLLCEKYGVYTSGDDKNAQVLIAHSSRYYTESNNAPLYPGFTPITVGDIGAGAIFGINGFRVAGNHGYWYEVVAGGWQPRTELIPTYEEMARAIAKADE
jgi:hypothetical protein